MLCYTTVHGSFEIEMYLFLLSQFHGFQYQQRRCAGILIPDVVNRYEVIEEAFIPYHECGSVWFAILVAYGDDLALFESSGFAFQYMEKLPGIAAFAVTCG